MEYSRTRHVFRTFRIFPFNTRKNSKMSIVGHPKSQPVSRKNCLVSRKACLAFRKPYPVYRKVYLVSLKVYPVSRNSFPVSRQGNKSRPGFPKSLLGFPNSPFMFWHILRRKRQRMLCPSVRFDS